MLILNVLRKNPIFLQVSLYQQTNFMNFQHYNFLDGTQPNKIYRR